MTKTIWKYQLEVTDSQTIVLPRGSKILSVQTQGMSLFENIVLYALVQPEEKEVVSFNIRIYGTGHGVGIRTEEYTFLGTVKLREGTLMFHVFYK